MQPPSKPFYFSRTLAANLVMILIIILVQLQTIPGIPPGIVPYLVAAIPVANMILRIITTQPLTLTAGPVAPVPLTPPVPPATVADFRPAPPADLTGGGDHADPLSHIAQLPGKGGHDGT